jgi:DNA topoisomerase VI subunit B
MKLTNTAFNIETEGTTEQGDFGIKDMGFVLELLRNKIYSNIPLAVCREYVCNARDAHREAGKPERPIEITLPTMLEPTYKVRDFGKSISPENMVDIFIQYGASTKRTTNKLTGGFGIGCKVFLLYLIIINRQQ